MNSTQREQPSPLPAWLRALTLADRRQLLGAHLQRQPHSPASGGLETLQKWREIPSLADDSVFSSLVSAHGLTINELATLSALPADALAIHLETTPPWLDFARRSFEPGAAFSRRMATSEEVASAPLNASEEAAFDSDFLGPVLPLIAEGAARLDAELFAAERRDEATSSERALALSEYHHIVRSHLAEMVIKPFVVEMRIASHLGHLRAAEPEGRYREFASALSGPAEIAAFFQRYPVLLRVCAERVERVASVLLDIVTTLHRDRPRLHETFGPLGQLTSLECGLGDAHRGGQTVTKLSFSCGKTLFRKPRSLAMDQAYHELYGWLLHRLEGIAFVPPAMLDRGTYGYMQLVAHLPCTTPDQVERFYYRHGVHLGLLYLLGGSDIHHENVLACEAQPILVDLEVLFVGRRHGIRNGGANALANRILGESVLASGLLPVQFRLDKQHDRIDLSGLGGGDERPTPAALPTWRDVGSDRMHLRRERTNMPPTENRPIFQGEHVAPWPFARSVSTGLSDALRAVQAEPQPAAAFFERGAELPVRFLLRSTFEYGFVLGESYHPYHLGDALDRDRYFDQLWKRLASERCAAPIFAAEKRDLWSGDIPFFQGRSDSTSLWTSSGVEIPGFLEVDGLTCAKERLVQLSEEETSRQAWLVRVAFARPETAPVLPPSERDPALRPCAMSTPLEVASQIGHYLHRKAISFGGEAVWLSVAEAEGGVLEPSVSGLDLYAGLPGIVLFLSHLARMSGERVHSDLAHAGLAALLRALHQSGGAFGSCGALDGLGGVLYALSHLGILLEDERLLVLAERHVDRAAQKADSTLSSDVVSGVAGGLLGLLSLFAVRPSASVLDAAMKSGDMLLARHAHGETFQWEAPAVSASANGVLQGGFGHGPAGALYALSKLYEVTQEDRYRRPIQLILDSLADELRPSSPQPAALLESVENHGWCRGVSGGVGAMAAIAAALSTTAATPPWVEWLTRRALTTELATSDCLCHGELGNVDMLTVAAHLSGQYDSVCKRSDALLKRAATDGWSCGLPVDSVGLMDGVAGIGYQWLRWSAPNRVPSVLLLAPPFL